jgi:hypothetical protein
LVVNYGFVRQLVPEGLEAVEIIEGAAIFALGEDLVPHE